MYRPLVPVTVTFLKIVIVEPPLVFVTGWDPDGAGAVTVIEIVAVPAFPAKSLNETVTVYVPGFEKPNVTWLPV
jgi:hypothetical protein